MLKPLQCLLQWMFMRVEALFNRAFGDRLNPFYHLGAISFFLFWVVAASGLYLYAFFDTSVAGAFDSVAALGRKQRFAGGILRSVHRYASDAMVLTMLIHMLRYFALDRLRGFRWFSWVSGVALIWLVYVCGINGYMLPWDQLAQFVVVATFEWLDRLPSFGGTLIRNFIYPSSVNDRLFSLFAFVHIGAPLLLLLAMWIHVQRVARASTQPPRPIAVSLLLTMLVLALLRPVASQGGAANLAVAVTALDLDWFYLAVYPLLYAWPAGQVWALLAATTVLLAALPWLRPWRRTGRPREFRMTVYPGGAHLPVRAGETLLEAGLRGGLALPYECRNGGCGRCLCTVLNGRVDHRAYQPGALPAASRAQGKALLCCAMPLDDVAIEVAVSGCMLRRYAGRVERMDRLSAEVMRLLVALPDGGRLDFAAGQYINILLDDGERRAFSFANPPHDNAWVELHVRLIPGGRFTTHVFTGMKVGDTLNFEGPLGGFTLREGVRPILFVAGATGFAPVKSIVEDAFQRGIQRPMRLYWGVRRASDLYMLDLAESWQSAHANFTVIPVLSEPDPQGGWSGRTGLVHEAILVDCPDLDGYEVYVCGSVKMVETATQAFIAKGLAEGVCFSDAFLPSTKPGLAQDLEGANRGNAGA